ncbi:hypothetical protein PC9H_008274 [Pleurotus ostreatus]|uniref:SHSP domain-containing protein n=1 Tax=Pleurotus ostreatus TaxID=5322 RepID=A0A8H6ZV55_PLEOS|nr:uncharacterized protein PC9H_008274 [Pleurotus ostreatus]KAF7429036.1 hypothetical protein PC9H_008274 [Pleurotus ostreatus]
MPWATPEQLAYMNTMVLQYHGTVKGTPERRKFNAELREGWSRQWPLLEQHTNMFSSYFREELIRRGLIPRRTRKPTPKKRKKRKSAMPNPPDPPARSPVASTESITIYHRRLVPHASPSRPSSQHSPTPGPSRARRHSPTPGPSRACRHSPTPGPSRARRHSPTPGPSRARRHSPTPVPSPLPPSSHHTPTPGLSDPFDHTPTPAQSRLRLQSPTPPVPYTLPSPASSHHSTSPSPFRVWTECVPSSQSPSPRPLHMPPKAGDVPVSPPAKILQKELGKCLAFHLELPGVTRNDIDLIIQGQRISVVAQTNEVSYKWSTDVGGQVIPESVRSGFADGVLRIIVNVTGDVKVTNAWRTFHISSTCPSW